MFLILAAIGAVVVFILGVRVGLTFGHRFERRRMLKEQKARTLPNKGGQSF